MQNRSIVDWASVKKIHKVINGIHTKNKIVQSILCSFIATDPYPNKYDGKTITYYMGPQTPSRAFQPIPSPLKRSCPREVADAPFQPFRVSQGRFSLSALPLKPQHLPASPTQRP